jgi:hypothetical protein
MNTLAKFVAPAALALVAFGAQASEVSRGDLSAQPARAGVATAAAVQAPVGTPGEVAAGDIGVQPIGPSAARATGPVSLSAEPVRSRFVIGA